jgi:hypothetical protein
MAARSLILHVHDWQDRDFVRAFESALAATRTVRDPLGIGSPTDVQAALRSCGYHEARIECLTCVDDVLSGVVHWAVRRGTAIDPTH